MQLLLRHGLIRIYWDLGQQEALELSHIQSEHAIKALTLFNLILKFKLSLFFLVSSG